MAISATWASGGFWFLNRRCFLICSSTDSMPSADRVGGGALQPHVERGVNAEGGVLEIGVLEELCSDVVHQVDEIRRFERLRAALGSDDRGFHGERVIAVVDVAVLAHQAEDDVAPLLGAVGMAEGVEEPGRWISPASCAASGRVIWLRSLPK